MKTLNIAHVLYSLMEFTGTLSSGENCGTYLQLCNKEGKIYHLFIIKYKGEFLFLTSEDSDYVPLQNHVIETIVSGHSDKWEESKILPLLELDFLEDDEYFLREIRKIETDALKYSEFEVPKATTQSPKPTVKLSVEGFMGEIRILKIFK